MKGLSMSWYSKSFITSSRTAKKMTSSRESSARSENTGPPSSSLDQTPSLIPNPIFENLYTKITFSLNHKKNVDAIADAMYMDREERKYIGMLKIGQAICRLMGRYPRAFQLSIPFMKASQNIPDSDIREHMKDFYKDYTPEKPSLASKITPSHPYQTVYSLPPGENLPRRPAPTPL